MDDIQEPINIKNEDAREKIELAFYNDKWLEEL